MKQRYTLVILLMSFVLAVFAVSPPSVLAGNYYAATANDLITAINAANASPAADTILLTSDITLTAVFESDLVYGNSGLPAIMSDITIEGQGHSMIRDAAAPNFRVLRVDSTGTLTLYNLTISGGQATSGTAPTVCTGGVACGGAIFSDGILVMTHTLFSANSAFNGGGLFLHTGSANIYDSTFSNNSSTLAGGGIAFVGGSLNIADSVFSGNSATTGAGVFATSVNGVTIDRCTFTGNVAVEEGGGLYGLGTVTNSTFSINSGGWGGGAYLIPKSNINNDTFNNNTATTQGGGAYFHSFNVAVDFNNLTFVGNTAPSGGGGGIYVDNSLSPISIWDSIIIQSGVGANCVVINGSLPANTSDLADDASCSGFTDLTNPAQDLNIGMLTDNGGSTKTIAINTPSPALDSATHICSSFDQRGITRGINAVGAANSPQPRDCDIGAFESGGVIRTLQFTSPTSFVPMSATTVYHVPLMLDSPLSQADTIKAYIWVSGGTAIPNVDYVPFGVQTVSITVGKNTASADITLLNPYTIAKTIILSFATQHGPGFSGPARLGTQLTHTISFFKPSPTNVAPIRNYFTTHKPTVTWNRVTNAFRYEIQADTDLTFGYGAIYFAGNKLSFTWPDELPNETYYWHVRACIGDDKSTCGAWSTPDTFTVFVS